MPSLHSGISASAPVESLGLRRILRYYHSRSPCSTTFHSGAISPRSRPTESGSARAYLRLRFARYRLVTWLRFGGFLIHSFSGRGSAVFYSVDEVFTFECNIKYPHHACQSKLGTCQESSQFCPTSFQHH